MKLSLKNQQYTLLSVVMYGWVMYGWGSVRKMRLPFNELLFACKFACNHFSEAKQSSGKQLMLTCMQSSFKRISTVEI